MAAWAIIEKDNKILFTRRSENTSRAGQWCVPGGRIKSTETPAQACLREVAEETGLTVEIPILISKIRTHYFFRCQLINNKQPITLNEKECAAYRWVNPKVLSNLGFIMDMKTLVPVLRSMGYSIS